MLSFLGAEALFGMCQFPLDMTKHQVNLVSQEF